MHEVVHNEAQIGGLEHFQSQTDIAEGAAGGEVLHPPGERQAGAAMGHDRWRHRRSRSSLHGTYGRLDYDAVEDALLCHVCGRWVKNLAQHACLSHKLSAADYRELEVSMPVIARLRAEGKLRRWHEDREK